MNIGLYSGVSSARANERRLEGIAANLANVDTNAYKRISTGTQAMQIPGGGPNDLALKTNSRMDFTQGLLKPSSSPYHVALMGPGFFAVEGPNGEMYTRNGAFHVNDEGVLQSSEGYPVAWESRGDPIDPSGEMVTIDGRGYVRQGRADIGKLKVTDFTRTDRLSTNGDGYFQPTRANQEIATDAVVHQQRLEGSNVSSIDELVALISIQRNFESARNVMSLIDQSYGRLTQMR